MRLFRTAKVLGGANRQPFVIFFFLVTKGLGHILEDIGDVSLIFLENTLYVSSVSEIVFWSRVRIDGASKLWFRRIF